MRNLLKFKRSIIKAQGFSVIVHGDSCLRIGVEMVVNVDMTLVFSFYRCKNSQLILSGGVVIVRGFMSK